MDLARYPQKRSLVHEWDRYTTFAPCDLSGLSCCVVHREIPSRVRGGSTSGAFHRWTTALNVKLLLPPRQSRGASLGRLGFVGKRVVWNGPALYIQDHDDPRHP